MVTYNARADAPLRLIVFDLDGTLVDSRAAIVAAMQQCFQAAGRAAPPVAAIGAVVGLKLETAMAALLPPESSAEEVFYMSESYREIFMLHRSEGGVQEQLFPGVRALLRRFDRPDLFLGIATGKGRAAMRQSLDRHRIGGHFTALACADDGPSKPHPAVLLHAIDSVGVEPAEAVFIGDTSFDMETARNAGTRALGVAWGHHSSRDLRAAGAGLVLESPAHLARTLNLLLAGETLLEEAQ
jgi:phosphoglycolate phosphatase